MMVLFFVVYMIGVATGVLLTLPLSPEWTKRGPDDQQNVGDGGSEYRASTGHRRWRHVCGWRIGTPARAPRRSGSAPEET